MIKVAAYCRVSTDKDDQANSFKSQRRYFREYIDRQPDWELLRGLRRRRHHREQHQKAKCIQPDDSGRTDGPVQPDSH